METKELGIKIDKAPENGNGHLFFDLPKLVVISTEKNPINYQISQGQVFWMAQRLLTEVQKSKADIGIFSSHAKELRILASGIMRGSFGLCNESRSLLENYVRKIYQDARSYEKATQFIEEHKRLALPLGRCLSWQEEAALEELLEKEEYNGFKDRSVIVKENDLVVLEDILNQFCKKPNLVLNANKGSEDALVVLGVIQGLHKSRVRDLIGIVPRRHPSI